ncbi:MAG: threonine/serine exporter family protein [Muribaculaceae bacterium]|nr:threonine/serine exporter family protein [Muribaculaceae bacterium]
MIEESITKPLDCKNLCARELCGFLSRYSAWLLGSGATCIRLETNVKRIAHAYGKEVELTVMPRHINVSVYETDRSEMITVIEAVPETHISYNTNTLLSNLSWEIADGKITFANAINRFEYIIHNDPQNRWLLILLVSMANASFCRLFGGDLIAMGIVAFATAAGYYLKQTLLSAKFDVRIVFVICALVSSILGATDRLFSLGTTPSISVGTSVLYLVPGIPFLNSFSDMLYRHYICAYSRFADAVVLTCCLSVGLCAGMLLMHVGMF